MKKLIALSVLVLTLFVGAGVKEKAATNTVRVTITGIKEAKGHVGIGIYNSEETFAKVGKHLATKRVAVSSTGSVVLEISNLADGTYGIAATHDLNSNEKFDTNWMGIPEEPYGFSNNVRHNFSAPTFDECKFSISGGVVKNLSIEVK